MKKIVIIIVALIIVIGIVIVPTRNGNTEYLRIHVRANSNDVCDQEIKYVVKNAVVEYLTPYVANVTSKEQAQKVVESKLDGITKVADDVLKTNGYSYTSNVKVCKETFPDRTYDGTTLPCGVYDALVVELGNAQGNNWWCVVYPPLCFVGSEANGTNSIVFKSKLLEIIRNWQLMNK